MSPLALTKSISMKLEFYKDAKNDIEVIFFQERLTFYF